MSNKNEIKNSLKNYTIDPETSCWNYNNTTPKGVGVIKHQGWIISPQRYFYLQKVGMVPNGWLVSQTCDNVSCCNPEHLTIQEDLSATTDLVYKGYRFCSVDSCSNKHDSNGLCNLHKRRLRDGVDMNAPLRVIKPVKEHFESKYIECEKTGCWEFTGYRNKQGYGAVKHEGKTYLAHRYAYSTFIGPIPDGMIVMHSCDNPPCINPKHLSVGTLQDNSDDMIAKGRQNSVRGSDQGSSVLTEEQVKDIYIRLTKGENNASLAREFNVIRSTIGKIRTGKNWLWLTKKLNSEGYILPNKPPSIKLTKDTALEIYNIVWDAKDNTPHKTIAEDYGVTIMTVSDIKHGRSWSSVTKHIK